MKEQSGYYVFYEKNPQMQEFVLGESKNESVDEQYEDVVTEAIRETVSKSTHKAAGSKPAMFVMMMAIAVMFVIGGNYMFESFAKINNLETAVDVLQSYVETTYSSEMIRRKLQLSRRLLLEKTVTKQVKKIMKFQIILRDRM